MVTRLLAALPAIALPALLLAVAPAFAAPSPLDYNGDGKVSREEFRNEAARAAFGQDKNSDGFLDDSEVKLDDAMRKGLDANGDGKVSVEEFQVGQMKGFDQLDKNNDGLLDAGEMK